jgi:hypothetical protein
MGRRGICPPAPFRQCHHNACLPTHSLCTRMPRSRRCRRSSLRSNYRKIHLQRARGNAGCEGGAAGSAERQGAQRTPGRPSVLHTQAHPQLALHAAAQAAPQTRTIVCVECSVDAFPVAKGPAGFTRCERAVHCTQRDGWSSATEAEGVGTWCMQHQVRVCMLATLPFKGAKHGSARGKGGKASASKLPCVCPAHGCRCTRPCSSRGC